MPRSATSTALARNVGSNSSNARAAVARSGAQAQGTTRAAAAAATTRATPTHTAHTSNSAPSQPARRSRPRYPEALPSEIGEVFSGPVQGTAVIGTDYTLASSTTMDLLLPKQHLAMMDQAEDNPFGAHHRAGKSAAAATMATPETQSHGGSERVFASHSISPDDLSTSHDGLAQPHQQQQQQQSLLQPVAGGIHSCNNNSSHRTTVPWSTPNGDSNTHAYNPNDSMTAAVACPYGLPCVHIPGSPPNVLDGGFVVFSDSFVEAHPQSRIAAVTQAYRKVNGGANNNNNNNNDTTTATTGSGGGGGGEAAADAEAQKSQLQKVRTYIKEVQEQSRPLFRRRPSEIVYGTAAYLPRSESGDDHVQVVKDDDDEAEEGHAGTHSRDEALCHHSFAT